MKILYPILFIIIFFILWFLIESFTAYLASKIGCKSKKMKYTTALKITAGLCLIMGLYYAILLAFRINWHEVKSFNDILNSVYLLY